MTETSRPDKRSSSERLSSKALARVVVDALLEKKGIEIQVMDMRHSGYADYFVLATGASELQVRALADSALNEARESGEKPWHTEGLEHMQWVVLDFVDVVVHVFLPEKRAFYGLERLWNDGQTELVPDTASASDVQLLADETV